jgi:uncharacterized protein
MEIAGFEWDDGNWPKCGKHGVSRNEIEFVLVNNPAVFADLEHSNQEERWKAIGKTAKGRYLFINFTLRPRPNDSIVIRPISARYMHNKEAVRYERAN